MFKFTVTQNSPEILAMEMNGELNTVAAQDLQEEIESLQKDMVKPIHIDVTRLNYISSTGLRIFMIIKKKPLLIGWIMVQLVFLIWLQVQAKHILHYMA